MTNKPLTESDSHYDHLEKMEVNDLLVNINKEDQTVTVSVEKSIPQIERLIGHIFPRMKQGGRLFYIGAGTSGRLGIVDASECPPTFGVDHGVVVGLIASGDSAIRKAVEFGIQMLVDRLNISHTEAEAMLKKHGSVRKAIESVPN